MCFFLFLRVDSQKNIFCCKTKKFYSYFYTLKYSSYEKTILSLIAFGPCGLHAGA